jgi:phospholipid transport system substrate-binding protein
MGGAVKTALLVNVSRHQNAWIFGMSRFLSFIFGLILVTATAMPVSASVPEDMVKTMAANVTTQVRAVPANSNGVTPRVQAIIEHDIVPRFDFNRITQIAMGRNWAKASPSEQREIVTQFTHLLVRTYSNAINNLRDMDVVVKGSRSNGSEGDVTVRTQMVGRNQPTAIDYFLSNASGGWKVYDVQVEGVSLVSAYRDEFTSLVSNSGIAGVIDALKKKNTR